MKSSLKSIVFLLLLVSLPVLAAQQETQRGLLWEITAPGISKPDYLLGTIHSEDKRVLALPETIKHAFDNASMFMMEIEPTSAEVEQANLRMMLPQGESLDTLLDKALYQQVVQVMELEHGVPEQVTARLKPWAVTMVLSMPKPESGQFLDEVLYQQAKTQGKRVKGLESAEEQLDVFDTLPMATQVILLKQALVEYKTLPAQTEALIEAWLQRDLDKLQQLGDLANQGLPAATEATLQRRLIDDRNQRMVTRMVPHLQKGGVFVAVGALHLPGEHGIIALLRQRGYTVRPVY